MSAISHLLNRTLGLRRPIAAADGAGGSTTTWTGLGPIPCRTSQPTATERLYAAQAEAEHSQAVYFEPDADVRKGDELVDGGDVWRVAATIRPSQAQYLRADCELIQTRGDP
jgi:hypothetical protein